VALAGAAVIAMLTLYFLARLALGVEGDQSSTGCEPPGLEILAFYAPLVAWAPLLVLVTIDYRRRMLRFSRSQSSRHASEVVPEA
jgi:hypothetical protein